MSKASPWLARARARKVARIRRARADVCAFIEYAFVDEKSGAPITCAPHHHEWQRQWSTQSRSVTIAPLEHGKTQQAIGKVLHLLGNNPSLRGVVLGNTAEMAEKLLKQVRQHIEENPRVREVFPGLVPSDLEGDRWGQRAITVKRPTIAKDPSLAAFGAYGLSPDSRVDFLVIDDILNFENTSTLEQMLKLQEWIDTTVIGRLTEDAMVICIGSPWHPEDPLYTLQKRGWSTWWKGAIENPDDQPEQWRPLWPARWPVARLLARRKELGGDESHAWQLKMLCRVRMDSTARFKQEWWDRACVLGRGLTFVPEAPKAQGGIRVLPCFAGVDLGVGKGAENAKTVIHVAALLDNGRKRTVDIQSGHWTAPEIITRLEHVYRAYQAIIMVESNAAQEYLVQMANERVPVQGRATGSNKHHREFGVEGLAVQLQRLEWVFPSGPTGTELHPELRALRQNILYYNPAQHTGDHLMAWWICSEAIRLFNKAMVGSHDLMTR